MTNNQLATMHPKASYSKLASYYDVLYFIWGKDYSQESEVIHSLIQKHKTTGGTSLLDLGCGTGEHLYYLKKKYNIVGVDVSPEMLEVARKKMRDVTLLESDMVNFCFEQRFDVITSLFSSISYVRTLPRLRKAIKSISNHLHTGGVVIIEPWFTREQYEERRYNTMFGEKGKLKACRMHETIYDGSIVKIKDHIMFFDGERVTYITNHNIFGLFSKSDFLTALTQNDIQPIFYEGGLGNRDLYVGIKL